MTVTATITSVWPGRTWTTVRFKEYELAPLQTGRIWMHERIGTLLMTNCRQAADLGMTVQLTLGDRWEGEVEIVDVTPLEKAKTA